MSGVAEIRDVALAHIFEKGPLHQDFVRPPQRAEPAIVLRRSGHAGDDLVRQIAVGVDHRRQILPRQAPRSRFAKGID